MESDWRKTPGRVLACDGVSIYLSRGYTIYKSVDGLKSIQRVAAVPAPLIERLSSFSQLTLRLGRLGCYSLVGTPEGSLISISRRRISRLGADQGRFETTFVVEHGSRPMGIGVAPDGFMAFGEYWSNPVRLPLRIYGSEDDGRSWEIIRTLPAKTAKHIHNVLWDDIRRGFWVLTGDDDSECALYFSNDHFKSMEIVARGGQQYRACSGFFTPEGICFGTDSEREPNWIVLVNAATARVERIHPLDGSCLNAARMAGRYYISTTVEKSVVNKYNKCVLWQSSDLNDWCCVYEDEKDAWDMRLFQFGSLVLPKWTNEAHWAVFSGMSVKNTSGLVICMGVEHDQQTSGVLRLREF